MSTRVLAVLALTAQLAIGGCDEPEGSDADADTDIDGDSDVDSDSDADVDGDVDSDGDVDVDSDSDVDGDVDSDADSDADAGPPAAVCTSPIELYDTSSPRVTIGDGTPASCVEGPLRAAAAEGGIIAFNCGAAPATIEITETIELPVDRDTIIDGGGLVTLDAGHRTRHFNFHHPDWMNNPNRFVVQRLTLINGEAPAGELFAQDPDNPLCAYGYKEGSGGAINMRNGVLHIIDCELRDNRAALLGPDVGGGAVYVLGVPEVIISGSRFIGNRAANGGAVGMLFANPEIYNSVFENNTAEGVGMNYVEPGCPEFNHDEQGGAGGNSGAVYFDGMNDDGVVYTFCGCVFRNNRANELGGALFRTPNVRMREMLIESCLFDGNTARMGGVSFIMQNDVTVRGTTFMHSRSGLDIHGTEVGGPLGGLWINEGSLDLENCTFFDNQPTGLDVEGNGGTLRNATVVDSRIGGGGISLHNCLVVDTGCSDTMGGDHNLQWPEASACAGGTTFADPGLGDIGDHGGPTPTFSPSAGGPVEGVGTGCPMTDQRGEPREAASCAAGAVEP